MMHFTSKKVQSRFLFWYIKATGYVSRFRRISSPSFRRCCSRSRFPVLFQFPPTRLMFHLSECTLFVSGIAFDVNWMQWRHQDIATRWVHSEHLDDNSTRAHGTLWVFPTGSNLNVCHVLYAFVRITEIPWMPRTTAFDSARLRDIFDSIDNYRIVLFSSFNYSTRECLASGRNRAMIFIRRFIFPIELLKYPPNNYSHSRLIAPHLSRNQNSKEKKKCSSRIAVGKIHLNTFIQAMNKFIATT